MLGSASPVIRISMFTSIVLFTVDNKNRFVIYFTNRDPTMEVQLILTTCIVNFGLTYVQRNETTDQFHDLFASMAKNDTKKSEIYHKILKKEVTMEQQVFDAMKEELWIVRNRNNYKKGYFYRKNNTSEKLIATKRETNGNNFDTESQAETNKVTYNWNVMDILNGAFSVMMLNTPIANPEFATSIWRKANFKIVVDGAGNRLYDLLFNATNEKCPQDLPHVLSGDFDSVSANVLNFFQKLNVTVVHTPDQEETDFFKGLKVLAENSNDQNVIVYCDTVGRLDHIMENLNTLFMCSTHKKLSDYNIFLLNHKSMTWLLRPGFHLIHIPPRLWTDKSYCGLIPVGQPCHHVTTKGLKYNLRDGEIQFGKMVSTSNGYDLNNSQMEVHISTDNKMVWTMTIDEEIFTRNL